MNDKARTPPAGTQLSQTMVPIMCVDIQHDTIERLLHSWENWNKPAKPIQSNPGTLVSYPEFFAIPTKRNLLEKKARKKKPKKISLSVAKFIWVKTAALSILLSAVDSLIANSDQSITRYYSKTENLYED